MTHTKKIVFQGGPLDETCRRVDVSTTYCEIDVKSEGTSEVKRLAYKKAPLKAGDIEIFKLVEDDKEDNNI